MPTDALVGHGALRLRLGALGAFLGPALIVTRLLLAPDFALNDVPTAMTAAAAHPTLVTLANVLQLLGFACVALAASTVMGLVSGRGRRLTQIAGWATTITWLLDAFASLDFVMAALAQQPDRGAMVAGMQAFERSPSALILLIPLASTSVWVVLLAFGLTRAGLVRRWYPVLAVLSIVASGLLTGHQPLVAAAAFVPVGAVVAVWGALLRKAAGHVSTTGTVRPVIVEAVLPPA